MTRYTVYLRVRGFEGPERKQVERFGHMDILAETKGEAVNHPFVREMVERIMEGLATAVCQRTAVQEGGFQ